MYNEGFESMDNSLYEHCYDGAIIVFPYYDLAKIDDPVLKLSLFLFNKVHINDFQR